MKNNKGFTLIELLVVVAIIGILAAVGTVAYTGYTASAKKNATKSNHASVVKYVASELQKCNIGESTYMGSTACSSRKGTDNAGNVSTAAETALSDFKNAEDSDGDGVKKVAAADSGSIDVVLGQVSVADDGSTVTISTCFAGVGDDDACDASNAESVTTNTVSIE